MVQDERDVLEVLKFELKFIEDGGYGRSPKVPWRPPLAFEDSPTCLNFNDSVRPRPCNECLLIQFVPADRREEIVPCWHIPLTAGGETANSFYGYGTQEKLEEVMVGWLRNQIARIEKDRQ
jgi:hypothetical protein